MITRMKRQAFLLRIVLLAALLSTALVGAPAVSAWGSADRTTASQVDEQTDSLTEVIEAAISWLVETHQNADGGFSSFSAGADLAPSDPGGTLDALWGLSVSGSDTAPAMAYLAANSQRLAEYVAQDGSTASKALLALAAEEDSHNFGGLDLAANLTTHLSPTGQFGVETAFNQSLAILGLAFSGHPVPDEAVNWLIEQQETEGELAGSWDDGFGTPGNADSTAMAIAALLASGAPADTPVIVAGRDFLARTQLDSGGWEYGTGFGENANSTALVLLALAMLGENVVTEDGPWAKGGQTPLSALLAWQGESGAFQVDFGDGRFDDFFSTAQALPVLAYAQSLIGQPVLEAPVVNDATEATAVEVTPTATPAGSPEPTATPVPTQAPATATPEVIAEATTEEPDASSDASSAESGTVEAAEEEAGSEEVAGEDSTNSTWPLIIGAGALLAVVAAVWWIFKRRQEA